MALLPFGSAPTPDATSSKKGKIQLAGDIAGSAAAPTIKSSVGLTGNPTTTTQASTDNSTKIATTAYVTTGISNAISGVNPAIAVQWATTTAGNTSGLTYSNGTGGVGATLTGANNTTTTFDGHTFVVGDVGVTRVLVKNDTQSPSGAFNGVYLFTALHTAGTGDVFTRALDYNTPSDINNTGAIPVVNGTANISTSWLLTSTVATVGTDPLVYIKFSINPTTILTNTLTSAHLLIGDVSNVATDTAITGDVTISNAGVTAIGSGKVTDTMLANQYALLLGRSGGQTLIGGTAASDDLILESTSNGTQGTVQVGASGDKVFVGAVTSPFGNANTKFAVNHPYTYSAGQTVIANDMRSLPTFDTTTGGKFTGADLTTIVSTSQNMAAITGVSFQAAPGGSAGTITSVIGVNAFATNTSASTAVTTATSASIGTGSLAGTITQQYGINFVFGGFTGTVTNITGVNITSGGIGATTLKVGVDIAALSGATTNIGIRNAASLLQQGAMVGTPTTVTVTTNAGTVPVTAFVSNFTNSSAANMTITMAVTGASDGQISMVRIYDATGVSKTITWVNTEVGEATPPASSNGSTNLPKTVTFMFNGATSLWRCLII